MPFINFFSSFFHKKQNHSSETTKDIATKKAAHFPFDFDRWYPYLKSNTAPSIIIKISPTVAQSMVNFYKARYLQNKDLLQTEQINILLNLENTLKKELKIANTAGYFVRMSDRSPKDGNILTTFSTPSLSDIGKSLVDKTPNEQLISLMDIQMQLLRCNTAEQMLHLLLSSERVYTDLLLALECHEQVPDDTWSTSIILRHWQPWLKQEHEFRVFVHGKQVTAISQYNGHCCYPSLLEQNQTTNQLLLINKILTYLKPLQKKIPFENYAIDLAIMPDHIQIIELNPFEPSTGSCLFSWKTDADILSGQHISNTPELRIQTEANPKASELIEVILSDLESRIDRPEQSYKAWLKEYKKSHPSADNHSPFKSL